MDILIIGAGIAGCCAAISLTQAGHSVQLIEKQAQLTFQSSGIFVYSNGLESLQTLDVLDEILKAGFTVPQGQNPYYDHTGTPITTTTYPTAQGGKIPAILGIKRAELHRILTDKVAALGVEITYGTTLAHITDTSAILTNQTTHAPDLIAAADGLRSKTRAMIGINTEPTYTGVGVWRAVHKRPAHITEKTMIMGPAKRFGIMPISNEHLYTFGTVTEPKDAHYPRETWPALMRDRFQEFENPARDFLNDLSENSEVLYTAVEEINLSLPWHKNRVVLIGDAAHASTPFMGQGGAMAMQDAVVLAQVLNKTNDLDAALTLFGELRFPLCQFVQNVSRAVGEAGASEDITNLSTRNAKLKQTAQSSVDNFYNKINELNAATAKHLS